MRVFVTGATGFIGSAVVPELLGAGHAVLGLARGDAGAAALAKAGAEVHRGELTDTDSLVAGARACDGVIHLAFIHDFSNFMASVETDRRAVAAMIAAMQGTDKPFVLTTGTMVTPTDLVPPGRPGTEDDAPSAAPDANPRGQTEATTMAAAERGVRVSVVRLAPTVHGSGDRAFVPMLIDLARRTGVAAYVGDGANRWPAVHRLDAARLFRLAVEKAAPGARLHGAAEIGVTMRAIAETIGERLGVPVRGLPESQAAAHFSWMSMFVGRDNPTSSAITRETLGWQPREADLLTDMREGDYFA